MSKEGSSMNLEYEIVGKDFTRAGEASSKAKKILRQLGINSTIIRKVSIAMYEAEMNIVIHSYGGKITVNITPEEIEILAYDKGPGIKDVELAMKKGYSTASNSVRELGFGAGMGLPNMKKFSDYFKVESNEGGETKVLMKIYVNKKRD